MNHVWIVWKVNSIDFLFLAFHTPLSLYNMKIYIWNLALTRCWCYEVRYLVWFKTATSSGRRIQFISNSMCDIKRFCRYWFALFTLSFTLSVTVIQLYKLIAHFPANFCQRFNTWIWFFSIFGAKPPAECAFTLYICIFVINKRTEQINSVKQFESSYLPEDMLDFEPHGVLDLITYALFLYKTQKYILH